MRNRIRSACFGIIPGNWGFPEFLLADLSVDLEIFIQIFRPRVRIIRAFLQGHRVAGELQIEVQSAGMIGRDQLVEGAALGGCATRREDVDTTEYEFQVEETAKLGSEETYGGFGTTPKTPGCCRRKMSGCLSRPTAVGSRCEAPSPSRGRVGGPYRIETCYRLQIGSMVVVNLLELQKRTGMQNPKHGQSLDAAAGLGRDGSRPASPGVPLEPCQGPKTPLASGMNFFGPIPTWECVKTGFNSMNVTDGNDSSEA